MEYTKRFTTGRISTTYFPYLLFTIAGLSFCFFLGFPFDNHNESYLWVTVLSKASLWDTLTKQIIHIESFRPLGMANAWITYRLTGNIYLQEILNWLFAVSSFILLFTVVKDKILFSLLSFITGAFFFSGYIYLFHLHGVFYGPFQLYVAALTCIAYQHRHLSGKLLVVTTVATVIICLYHTFALLIFCAFLSGYMLQLTKKNKVKDFIKLGGILLFTLVLTKIILQGKEFKTVQTLADGFFVSYRMVEINKMLVTIAVALPVLTILSLSKKRFSKIIAAAATLLVSLLFLYCHFPVLLLWVGICLIKTIINKNWALAALIAAAAILPLGSGSGSPTYVVFVLMICAFITASDNRLAIPDQPIFKKSILVIVLLLFSCVLALKTGHQLPLLSSMAKPILAEEEKSHQLKEVTLWKLNSKEYAAYRLVLYDAAGLPVNSNNTINRTNRPVASQAHLDIYMDFFEKDIPNAGKTSALYITFGNEILAGKELVFSVTGKWNGPAYVFR